MFESHIDEFELHEKIIALFEYRLFPSLLDLAPDFSVIEKLQFVDDLVALQKSIYHLDAHLEAHWDVNEINLAFHWQNIQKHLLPFGIKPENAGEYLNHIKKYEKHELELRIGKSPLRFEMEYFYFYKSCDVKLLRRLIYEKFGLSGKAGQLSDWRYYDLVTEVNDDVEDIFEDLQYINGNRFLISTLALGKTVTKNNFIQFLSSLDVKSKNRYDLGPKSKIQKMIFEVTRKRIDETQTLLLENITKISQRELNNSLLFQHQNFASI